MSPRRLAGTIAIAVAVAGAALLISPLHLVGAVTLVLGVALFCYTRPVEGLWLVLILSALHPIVAKAVQVNLGATGSAVVVFSAWKEIGLAAVVLADLVTIARDYRRGRRWPIRLGPMDVMAVALVALVVVGVALRHDLMAVNAARLLLFPVGIYFALRFSPVDTTRYFKAIVLVAAGVAVFAIIQSSVLGWGFITTYWGIPSDPLPVTFVAQHVDGPRASATFGSPNELAFALIAWSLMCTALLIGRPRTDRWLILALAAILVGLALTFSRSAILAGGLGLVLLVVAAARLSPTPRRAIAVIALGVMPAVLLSGVAYASRGGVEMMTATADTFLYGASSGTKTVAIDVHSWVAGEPQAVTITIKNIHGAPEKSYRGTIHFVTSDPNATLPDDYTFNADDAGVHTFGVTSSPPLEIVSVGPQWIRVTDKLDGNITSEILGTFAYPPATALKVEVASWSAGKESAVTVTAVDADGRPWAAYRGTIHFTSSDPGAGLPADYTFSAADAGKHTFEPTQLPPLIFYSPGDQWLRATDKIEPSVTAMTSGDVVSPKSVAVEVQQPWQLGTPQSVTVTIRDLHGHPDPSYRGTIHFATSDPGASLPVDYTFTAADAGRHVFQQTGSTPLLVSAGRQWVRVTDTSDTALAGQVLVTFTYPPSTALKVEVASWSLGKKSAVTVTAVDADGRPWTAYRGTIHFTSSDPGAGLPADYTFSAADAGTHTFAPTQLPPLIFHSPGDQWLRATDKVDPSVTGMTSGGVGNTPAASIAVPATASSPVSTATPVPPSPSPTVSSVAPTPPASLVAPRTSPPGPTTPPVATPAPNSTPVVVGGYVSAADSSAAAHLTSLGLGWQLLTSHPLGTGLGTVGPRPLPGTSDFPSYIIESYYLAMGVSLGWLGFLWAIALPLAMLALALMALRRGHTLEGTCLLAIGVTTAAIGVVLPTMMEPQIAMIPWSVCALAAASISRGDAPGGGANPAG